MIAVLALQVVIAVAAIESVVLRTATDEVISVFTVEAPVFTGPTVQGVVALHGHTRCRHRPESERVSAVA